MAYTALITGASSGIGEATGRLAREPDTHVILVARREERLRALAAELGATASVIAADLTDPGTPARIRTTIESDHGGALHMLVNNAGARWSADFADAGWANVERHMRVNFEAPVRLIEALLPLLRAAAPAASPDRRVCIVNVASTAARVGRPGAAGYAASKFAIAGWSESLYNEERPHGVHVGLVLPGFVQTEGFPARELIGHPLKRRLVAKPELVAEAIVEVGPGGRPERFVPRFYAVPALLRAIAPSLIRRATAGGTFTTRSEPSD
jgi:uncharacterized protein